MIHRFINEHNDIYKQIQTSLYYDSYKVKTALMLIQVQVTHGQCKPTQFGLNTLHAHCVKLSTI